MILLLQSHLVPTHQEPVSPHPGPHSPGSGLVPCLKTPASLASGLAALTACSLQKETALLALCFLCPEHEDIALRGTRVLLRPRDSADAFAVTACQLVRRKCDLCRAPALPGPVHLGAVLCSPPASGHGPTAYSSLNKNPTQHIHSGAAFPSEPRLGGPEPSPYQIRQTSNHLWRTHQSGQCGGALLCVWCPQARVHWGLSVAWREEHTCHRSSCSPRERGRTRNMPWSHPCCHCCGATLPETGAARREPRIARSLGCASPPLWAGRLAGGRSPG